MAMTYQQAVDYYMYKGMSEAAAKAQAAKAYEANPKAFTDKPPAAPKAPAPSARSKATPSTKAAPSASAPKVEPPKPGPAVKAEVPTMNTRNAFDEADRTGRPVRTDAGDIVYPSRPITPRLAEAARNPHYATPETMRDYARGITSRGSEWLSRDTPVSDRYMATSPASPPPEPEGSEVAAKYSGRGYVSGGGGRLSEYENAPMTTEDKRRAAMDAFKDNPAMVTKIKAITKPEQIDDLYAKLQAEE